MRMCARVRSRLGTSDGGRAGSAGQEWWAWQDGGPEPHLDQSPACQTGREINVLAAAPCLVPHPDPDPAF